MRTLCAALLLLTATLPLAAKGRTVKIVISGDSLTSPVEITGRKAEAFHIWAGPGVFVNGVEQTEGFIIEWKRGRSAPPQGVAEFLVSFYTGCDRSELGCSSETPELAYLVIYTPGFVYLPGLKEEAARINIRMTHGDGYEGNWLRATAAWDAVVRPLLEKK